MTDAAPYTLTAPVGPRPLARVDLLHLRAEGIAQLALGLMLFHTTGESWLLFAALLLAPDLAFFGYLSGPRFGAACYNAVHSYLLAGLLLGTGWALGAPLVVAVGAILWSHIGMDRAVGYGFKSAESAKRTHLDLP